MESLCEICEGRKAILKCQTCKKFQLLCAECFQTSHNNEQKKQHQLVLVKDEAKSFSSYDEVLVALAFPCCCPKHTKRQLDYVCKKCKVVICSDCFLIGEHKGHDAIEFEQAWQEYASSVEDKMKTLTKQIDKVKLDREYLKNFQARSEKELGEYMQAVELEFKNAEELLALKKIEIRKAVQNIITEEKEKIQLLELSFSKNQETLESKLTNIKLILQSKSPSSYEDWKSPELQEISLEDSNAKTLVCERKSEIKYFGELMQSIKNISFENKSTIEYSSPIEKITKNNLTSKKKEKRGDWIYAIFDHAEKLWYEFFYQKKGPINCYNSLDELFASKMIYSISFNECVYSLYSIVHNNFFSFKKRT